MPQKRTRPRAITLTLADRKQPHLLFQGKKYWLRNFSEEGIGVWMPTPPFPLHRGLTLRGDIEIGQDIHPVSLEVVHATETVVGLHIVHRSLELKRIFRELLEPSIYANDLSPHANNGAEDPTNGYRRVWYQGPGPSELVVWHHPMGGLIEAIQVCWLGHWVFREKLKVPETGALVETYQPDGNEVREEMLHVADETVDTSVMRQAAQFLAGVPTPLPGLLLWQFLETGEQVFLGDDKNFRAA